jgi:hypothetical protein
LSLFSVFFVKAVFLRVIEAFPQGFAVFTGKVRWNYFNASSIFVNHFPAPLVRRVISEPTQSAKSVVEWPVGIIFPRKSVKVPVFTLVYVINPLLTIQILVFIS